MRMYSENNKILFSNKEKESALFKKKLPSYLIKKLKKGLWKSVTKKKRQQFEQSSLEKNPNLFFSDNRPLVESQLKEKLLAFLPQYTAENAIHKLYQCYIQHNKTNEHAYLHFYNKLSAKIDILKIISIDQGKNIPLNPNLVCKLIALLTYPVGLVSSAILHAVAACTRHGINEISNIRKIKSTKNKLNHCITDLNFVKLLSIILTKIHEPDFAHQEKIDYFLDEQFLIFWSLFKKQAKIGNEIPDLNDFWSTCLLEYVKELKCPLLKGNFERRLNKMLTLVNPPPQTCPQRPTEINPPKQSKDFNIPSQEDIFLAQLILQMTISYHLTKMLEFNQTAKLQKNSPAFPSTLWRNGKNNSRDNCNRPSSAINPIFSPRAITCH